MKKKLNKYDYLAINRVMNQNFNGGLFLGMNTLKITKGEEQKLAKKEQEQRK